MNALLLGLGNDIKRDDVVGLDVTEALGERFGDRLDVETYTSGRLMLIQELSGYDRVFLVDAIKTDGGTPGDYYEFSPSEVEPGDDSGGLATHNVGLGTLQTLGEAMGQSMPEITIFAIEVENPFEYGEGMTDAVSEAVPALVDEIGDDIEKALAATATA
ncbi:MULTISPECIES: hydrogenase maturation protease [unclassified Halorhabdus]|uniref:hydrogenase maturation protease n=1 Tax=unclassified Halorhabdus TaxID=2621901 RepID=UPI0023DC7358|nr:MULTISPECIES: hydrogenase maturation protease [unclassified Halorhabdus]WEL18839.1 Hydrogenase maturation protease [Halorhabdus sp. SVX81]WEL22486.1 Hydrogenase maturation protease [Halorhabdus sp. BNX81]